MPLLILLLTLCVGNARAACAAPTDVGTLSAASPRAQLAMSSLDLDGFNAAVADARTALPCLGSPLTPLDAAEYHALMGLAAFAEDRRDDALASFAAAFAARPDYRLPTAVAAPGSDLDLLMQEAKALPPSAAQALPPYDGVILVDGARALTRPTGRPSILQLVGPKGDVRETHYLAGADPLPKWAPPPTLALRLLPEPRERPSVPFAVAAGSTALAAGGLYAFGGMAHAQYVNPATPYEDLPGLETQTNAALGGSIILGVACAALTTLTFLEW